MKLATTTTDFKRSPTFIDRIIQLYNAGFRHIDMSFYEKNEYSEFLTDDWKERALKIKEFAENLGMDFVQAHTPGCGNPMEKDDMYDELVKSTIRSIEVCGILGIKNAVIHTGWKMGVSKEDYFKINAEFLRQFVPYIEANDVTLCVENSTRANMGEQYFFFTGSDMKEFVDYFNHPNLKACWDTGHANCEGHQYEDIMALGSDLKALHINDNRGKMDEHLVPFIGNMAQDEIMHALIDSGYNGYFTLEAGSSFIQSKNWLASRKKYKDEDRLIEPPEFIYDEMEKLLYKIARYMLESYNLFEE